MRMKKKIFWLVVTVLFLIYSGKRIYWYNKHDCNNLSITLWNQFSSPDKEGSTLAIEVYIDRQLYYKNDAFSEPFLFLDDLNVSLGYHRLKVVIDSRFVIADDFFVFPMKWIVVECLGNSTIDDVMLCFYTSPPIFM